MFATPESIFQILTTAALSAVFMVGWGVFFYFYSPRKLTSSKMYGGAFILGIGSVLIAYFLEKAGFGYLEYKGIDLYFTQPWFVAESVSDFLKIALFAFGFVGLIEEFAKFILLKPFFGRVPIIQAVDGMKAGFFLGLGFAFIENILYFYGFYESISVNGVLVQTIILRGILSTLAHGLYGMIMGYYLALAKFHNRRAGLLLKSLFWAIFVHGLFDFFLMINQGVVSIGALALILLLVVYWYAERRNQELNLSLVVGGKTIIAPTLLANKEELRELLKETAKKIEWNRPVSGIL